MSLQSLRKISPGSSSRGPRSGDCRPYNGFGGKLRLSPGMLGRGGDGGRRDALGCARELRLPTSCRRLGRIKLIRGYRFFPVFCFLLLPYLLLSTFPLSYLFLLPFFFISILLLLSAVFQISKSLCIYDN